MAWTKSQEAAIISRGQNLLLSAAAGSGKTAVLVERIIQRLLDKEDPMDVTALLVVTFTKAAATEMRERIGLRLQQAWKETGDPRIERQLALLGSAQISTLHSFCQSVIRQYFYTIDMDPQVTIASEEELKIVRKDIGSQLLLQYYEQEDNERFRSLADRFGSERGDDGLLYLIERLYTFSRSMAWPNHWLEDVKENYHIPEGKEMDDIPWAKEILSFVHLYIEEAISLYKQGLQLCRYDDGPKAYEELFEKELSYLEKVYTAQTWKEVEEAIQLVAFARLPSIGKKDKTVEQLELMDQCKALRDTCKKTIKELQDTYFSTSGEEWIQQTRQLYPYISLLVELTQRFAQAYETEKKEKKIMDFGDLEQRCLEILLAPESTPEHPVPSEAARELKERFQEVLVDEYQDTNGVQEMIASLVSRGNNRFMVGDIKQSIYRFRLADPTLFLEKYQTYDQDEVAQCRRIDLSQNFRSDATVLDGINYIFERIMTKGSAEMEYGEKEKLYPGRILPQSPDIFAGGTIEVHLVECAKKESLEQEQDQLELTAFEEEAYVIAERIQQLMEEGTMVSEKEGTYRPMKYGDVVILLRSMTGKAEVLVEVLKKVGIPVFAEQNTGYFEAAEVRFIRSLLACIDNPLQDIPMAAVLHSPIVGLSMEDLGRIRLEGKGCLWTLLPSYADHYENNRSKIWQFIKQLESWRTFARRNGVGRLLLRLYKETGYMDYVGGLEDGVVRQRYLKAFYDKACQYEQSDFRGLFRFLRFLDRLEEEGVDMAPPASGETADSAVRIMSIHKSKGLEFPIVIVADTAKEFNQQDSRSAALFHQQWGIGLKQYHSRWRMWYPTISWHAVRHQLEREGKAEEQRVLYVALTRAKDKLIITGTSKELQRDALRWQSYDGTLRDSRIVHSRSYLDWLMQALLLHDQGGIWLHGLKERLYGKALQAGYWRLWLHEARHRAENETVTAVVPTEWEALRKKERTGHTLPEEITCQLQWHYGHEVAVHTPAKVSVSEIKSRQQPEEEETLPLFPTETVFETRPSWEGEKETGGTAYGTLFHRCMQYIDMKKTDTKEDVKKALWSLYEEEILQDEPINQLVEGVYDFFTSPLGRRMKAATVAEREVSFSVLLDASWYDPKAKGEDVFLQGVIDCLWEEEGQLILVDYKTDRISSVEELVMRYRIQLALYKEAIQTIRNQSVGHTYIYSTKLKEYVEI